MKKVNIPQFACVLLFFFNVNNFFANDIPFAKFITTWITTDSTITIPTSGSGYNYTVSWDNLTNSGVGNGSVSGQTGNYTITGLTNNDVYQISISGDFPTINFKNDSIESPKIQSIEQWGDISWKSMENAFWGCTNLIYNAIDSPDLSQVTNCHNMFGNCSLLNGNLNNWDVSSVTNMCKMFFEAKDFNGDISAWNVSNVTNMDSMFMSSGFNQNISDWDVGNVTTMAYLFAETEFNQDISNWNVSNVENMEGIFFYAYLFNQDIGAWDVSKVSNMKITFLYALSFNQDIGGWDVSNVTNMIGMFALDTAFNQNIGDWDVSSVTYMPYMFYYAWNFNQDLSNWNVSNVTNMDAMFFLSSKFNQSLANWNISKVDTAAEMLSNTALSIDKYDSTLVAWSQLNLKDSVVFGAQDLKFCSSELARQSIIDNFGWTFTGDSSAGNVDTLLSLNGLTLSVASDTLLTYQWVDCNNANLPIDGETQASFTPIVNGNYSVVIKKNGCISQSSCKNVVVTSVKEPNLVTYKVYPNPNSSGIFILENKLVNFDYILTDISGKTILIGKIKNEKEVLNFSNILPGVYLLSINGEAVTLIKT